MLIECPECKLQISDKAYSCPHCGYPMKGENKPRKERRKRLRLPNGFGQISEIKNRNLRKPFRAMITVGKNEQGRPISKLLTPEAYFSTYNEAYAALLDYNRRYNVADLDPFTTLNDVKKRWADQHYKNISPEMKWAYENAYKYCEKYLSTPVKDIRPRHIKECLDLVENPRVKNTLKTLFNLILDCAMEYDLVSTNCSRQFKLPKDVMREANSTKREHIAYTEEEISILWSNLDKNYLVPLILVQCYSGWRPNELLNLKISGVDLDSWTFTGGSKTDAGKNRIVPIHEKIKGIVKTAYDADQEYLFRDEKGRQLRYANILYDYSKLVKRLGLNANHRPHDGRKHFVTQAKAAGVDEYAIKYLVGHTITDLTERVYTERNLDWLRAEISKLT